MIGVYKGFKTRKVTTKKGSSDVYDALIDGKSVNVGFKKDIIENIPVGATVEYSVSGQYDTLSSIVITTKALQEPEKKEPVKVVNSPNFVPQDFSTPNRLRALEIIFPVLFNYYTSPDRKQKLSIPAIIDKSLAFADIVYNYGVTGKSVIGEQTETVEGE